MCVIFDIPKNKEVPFDKYLKPACLRNKDGWGIVVVDRGKLLVERFYEKDGYDPEQVMKKLEEYKSLDRMLHVRFTTKGEKSINNVHPFEVLSEKTFGYGIQMMHNGTFHSFGGTTRSDSREFAEDLLTPLTETFYKGGKTTGLFEDPTYEKILKEFVPNSSIVTLIGSDGKKLIIDKGNSGKTYEDSFWASNNWYFEKERSTYQSSVPFRPATSGYYGQASSHSQSESASTSKGSNVSVSTTSNDNSSTTPDTGSNIIEYFQNILKINENFPVLTKPNERDTFCKVAGIKDFDSIRYLGEQELQTLIEEYPDETCLLLQDLIWVYTTYCEIAKQKKN